MQPRVELWISLFAWTFNVVPPGCLNGYKRSRINFSVEFPAGIDAVIHSAPPLRTDCLLLVAMVTGFLKETLHVTHFVLLER